MRARGLARRARGRALQELSQSATYAATTGANDHLPPYLATTVIIRATP